MLDFANRDFYRRREQQERMLAESAQAPESCRIHAELADRYLELIRAPANRPVLRIV